MGRHRPPGRGEHLDQREHVRERVQDRPPHPRLSNWCNQSGAGLGERPQAAPAAGFDAYVWIKPPGESDGASREIQNDEGKRFDRMCDPTYTGNELNGNNLTGALADAPISGQWFSAQFRELVRNAYPPLS
ncbi:glycoside hydrolase family 6 protein [Nonomuraea ferruginea]